MNEVWHGKRIVAAVGLRRKNQKTDVAIQCPQGFDNDNKKEFFVMDDNRNGLVFTLVMLAIIAVVCVTVLVAGVITSVAGASGVLWGGGTALINYGKSFKENMIDSNRAVA